MKNPMSLASKRLYHWFDSIRRRLSHLVYPEVLPPLDFQELVLHQISQNSTLGFIVLDARQGDRMPIVFSNTKFLDSTGFNWEDIKGKAPEVLFGDMTIPSELTAFKQQKPCSAMLQRTRQNGQAFFGELLFIPLFHPQTGLIYYVGLLNDVTARHESESSLARSEAHYRQMFHNHSAVKLLIDPQTGSIKDANSAAVTFYGYSLEQLKSMRIQDINMLSEAEVTAEMKRATSEERNFFEFRHRLSSGEIRDVNVYSNPIDMPEGCWLFSIILDVTKKREAEQRYRALFEQSNDAVFILDLKGKYLAVNRRAATMFGYAPEEILNRTARDMVMPDQLEDSDKVYERIVAGEIVPPYERTFRRKDGTPLYAEVNVEAVRDTNGKITHVQSLVRDISERKRMQEELRDNEEKFRAFLAQSADGILMIDETGVIIEWNPGMERLSGIASQKAVGCFIWDVQFRLLPPENQTPQTYVRFKTRIMDALTSGDAPWLNEPHDTTLIRPDGTQTIIQEVMFSIKTSQGFKFGGVLRDIQRRRQMEDALRRSEERQRAILHAIPDLIFRLRSDGTILDCHAPSSQNIVSVNNKGIGKGYASVVPEVMGNAFLDTIQCALKSGHVETREIELAVQGEQRQLEVRSIPVDKDEVLVIVLDITERKLALQRDFDLALETERANLLTQFIQDAAHEFRTPLAVISASTHIMMRVDDPVQRLTKKAQIDDEVKRIARLVDMLLTIARLESSQPLNMQPLALDEVIEPVCQYAITTHGHAPPLLCEKQTPLPLVMIDPNYLTDAVRQLLDNAYQFTPASGTITVALGHENNRVWLEVRDTGCGIAEEDMPHLFELFWRHDEAHSTAGFGLGLPIAQRIAGRHGGEISASSTLGRGSCFRITLPVISNE